MNPNQSFPSTPRPPSRTRDPIPHVRDTSRSWVREKKPKPERRPAESRDAPTGALLAPTWLSSYGRLTVTLVMLAGALYHALVLARRPELLQGVADLALLQAYRVFVLEVVVPNAGLFTAGLIGFHVLTGLAVLGRGRRATIGLALIAGFLLALIPAIGAYNTMNVPFLLLVTLLLLRPYPATVGEELRSRRT